MNSGLSAAWVGESELAWQLELFKLSPKRRKRAMAQMGREVKKRTRQNVRHQKNTKGRRFEDRRKKRTLKGKMLSGFVRGKNLRHKTTNSQVEIGFRNDRMARMANAHQTGQKQTVKAQRLSASKRGQWSKEPATRVQAAAMNRLGFRVEKKGGRKRRVSQAWIMANITRLQAMGLLYKLEGEQQGKQSWAVELPAREFFANDVQWVSEMATAVMESEFKKGK